MRDSLCNASAEAIAALCIPGLIHPFLAAMSSLDLEALRSVDEKHPIGEAAEVNMDVVDAKRVKEVEELEERLARDEASEQEYLVTNAHDVAIKVRNPAP